MDKNGKIFGKINIIDLAAIVIVLVALIGIAIRFTSVASENVTRKTDFTYTVEVDNVRIYTVNALQKMGTVTDKQGNIVGEITAVQYGEKEVKTVLESGRTVKTVVPERYTVRLTLEASGKEADSGYFVGENTELSIGASISMYTKHANCSGRIIDVEKIENQG